MTIIWSMVPEISIATDIFLSSLAIFCSVPIIILHKCTKTCDHRLYCSWDMTRNGYDCYFSFWALFCPFTPINSPKNQNFKKLKKTRINHHFTHGYQKLWLDDVWFLRYGARRMDGQTDGRTDGRTVTKSYIRRWVPN